MSKRRSTPRKFERNQAAAARAVRGRADAKKAAQDTPRKQYKYPVAARSGQQQEPPAETTTPKPMNGWERIKAALDRDNNRTSTGNYHDEGALVAPLWLGNSPDDDDDDEESQSC